jgi:uncharacterized protein (DUF433 family)
LAQHVIIGKHQELGDVIEMETKFMGRYVVTDPEICHGKPTFRGTRILVADVLEQVADGLAWETISEEWRGSISHAAIAEAVRLSRQAFLENVDKYALEPITA